ncbi:MAG: hypothetical protein HY290_33465 [Planctomycetia bacterium]|nr:hypothetical protein [Planctomycetia bacterium]
MDATLIRVADAVLAELNDYTFSMPFEAERVYLPRHTPKELKDLRVTVVPAGWDSNYESRHSTRRNCTIQVGLQKKLATEDNAEIDPLVGLAQEIEDRFREIKRLKSVEAILMTVEGLAVPADDDDLDQRKIFTSVLSLTYRVVE